MKPHISINRARLGIRGSVRICSEEASFPTAPKSIQQNIFQFDPEGRLTHRIIRNPDGTEWEAIYSYNSSGLLLKTAFGMKGGTFAEVVNEYDELGRIRSTFSPVGSLASATYIYDERGRKKKVQTSHPEDYRPNLSFGGSPFESNDHAPNLPGGGVATTWYDEQDRPCEIEVRDETGELVKRVVRTYDENGNIAEEEEILPDPIAILPQRARVEMLQSSGATAQDLRDQISRLMAGQSGPSSVKYEYDAQGRLSRTHRRIFDREDTIETSYNEYGDVSREVARGKEQGGPPRGTYSETEYIYKYDSRDNWIEKIASYRVSPDAPFEIASSTFRTLTYF